jgi:hypothetical protein
MYQFFYQSSFLEKSISKYNKLAFLALIIFSINNAGYSQTFPVLPSPNYDIDHTSLVRGTVSQNGSGGIAGILVKLKTSDGNVISYTLTNNQGAYELSAKAETDNYTLEIEYPSDGFSVTSSPSVFSLSANQVETGKDFKLERKSNTLTVCDVHSLELTPWGLSSNVYLNLTKPDISTPYSSVKLFTSAMTSHPELQIVNTNNNEPARVTRLDVGAIVYHEAPSSSSNINSAMEFAKSNIGGSQNLLVPASTTYTYYDISSGKTWTSSNLSNAAYNTDGSNVQIQIAASAEITSTINGGNATFSVSTNANAGACLVYTYPSDPLPVRLISFDVTSQNGEPALLKWKTAEENLSREFQVEKSMNAREWTKVVSIPTTNRGTYISDYQYYDNEIWEGTTYYRLKMVDQDGSYSYSTIRSLNGNNASVKLTVFPNPISASSGQMLQFSKLPSPAQKIEIFSISGALIHSVETPDSEGINIGQLEKGLYIVKVILQNGQIMSSRIIAK